MERFFCLFFFLLFSTASLAEFDARTALAETQAESQRISRSSMAQDEKRLRLDALEKRSKHLRKIIGQERLDNEAAALRKEARQPLATTVPPMKTGVSPATETLETPALLKLGAFAWRAIQNVVLWGVVLGMIALIVIGALDSFESGSRFLFWAFRISPSASLPTDRSDGIPHRPSKIGRAFGEGIFPGGLPQKGGVSFSAPFERHSNRPKTVPRDGVVPIHLR